MCSTPLINIGKPRVERFVIDFAKTLYLPTVPKEWQERLAKIDREKLPAFFKYAKGKADSQIKERGNNVVDRIYTQMPMYKFRFNLSEVGPFDYRLLMYNDAQKIGPKEQEIVDVFREESLHIGANTCSKFWEDDFHWAYKFKALRKKMDAYGSQQYVSDVLIKALFDETPTKRKAALWYCYGDVIYSARRSSRKRRSTTCPPARSTSSSVRTSCCKNRCSSRISAF